MSKYRVGDEVVILLHVKPGTVSSVRTDELGGTILEITEHYDGQVFMCREFEIEAARTRESI